MECTTNEAIEHVPSNMQGKAQCTINERKQKGKEKIKRKTRSKRENQKLACEAKNKTKGLKIKENKITQQ